jgi:hypothetical protein
MKHKPRLTPERVDEIERALRRAKGRWMIGTAGERGEIWPAELLEMLDSWRRLREFKTK